MHSSHARRAAELADNASFIQLPSQCLGKRKRIRRMSPRATWLVTRTTPAGVAASGEAPRPDVVGGSEGTAKCFCDCDPCRELQARSLPRQPRHIPTRAHTHPAHSPAASSPPPPRARPGRRERESKGGCRLESAGSAPMKVGSAAAGWEGRKGRRRRRRQAVAHMQWMSGGACADRTPSSPKSHTHTPVPRAGFLTIPHTGVYRIESFRIPQ